MRYPGRKVEKYRVYLSALHLSFDHEPGEECEAVLYSSRVRRFIEDNFELGKDWWVSNTGDMYYFKSREHACRVFREFEWDVWYMDAVVKVPKYDTRTAMHWDTIKHFRLKTGHTFLLRKLSA